MIEAPPKWICRECGAICAKHLAAVNPFDPSDTISGCPNCLSAETLVGACQVDDCKREASGGYPNALGFRYVRTCHDHAPRLEKETKP